MRHFHLTSYANLFASAGLILVAQPMLAVDQDHRIESSARSSYNFKTFLKDDHIKVGSVEGVVTLSGSVAMEYHRALAENTVSGLPGVKRVVNNLTIAGDPPPEHSDAWMTMKVKGVLAFHKNVSASDTEVSTQNGVVTLNGKASTESCPAPHFPGPPGGGNEWKGMVRI